MTKIVINRCYGGFGLSPKAEAEYLKRKGKQAYFYDPNFSTKTWTKITDISQISWFYHTVTVDLGDVVSDDYDGYNDEDYFSSYSIQRDDPDLISVIEELGADEASGLHANLSIVEIPDDVDWEIDEYDGMECISEKHQTWS
jgi:hypothetical protein